MSDTAYQNLVLFDGVCNLCNASVRFVIARDPRARYRFASLQSESGARAARAQGVDPAALNSVLLIENDHCYTRSTAALRICRYLRWPWPFLFLLIYIPACLRDPLYRLIAGNRYRLFGKRNRCWLPEPDLEDRFID